MGDCRAVNTQPPTQPAMDTSAPTSADQVKNGSETKPEPMETSDSPPKPMKPKSWIPRKQCKLEDVGKITYFLTNSEFGSSEATAVFSEEKSHCIVSPR